MIAIALQAVAAFNLVCSGTHVTATLVDNPHGLADRREASATWTYRVDLVANRWCRDACETTQNILRVTDTMIYFRRMDEHPFRIFTYVSRETGEILDQDNAADQVSVWRGRCERAPFSGFPARRF